MNEFVCNRCGVVTASSWFEVRRADPGDPENSYRLVRSGCGQCGYERVCIVEAWWGSYDRKSDSMEPA